MQQLVTNSLTQFWWQVVNTTNGQEELGQWSFPAISIHSVSTLRPAAMANIWKITLQVQIYQKAYL